MIPVHFHAVFLPDIRKFKVQVKLPSRGPAIELMTIARFLRFARSHGPLEVGGLKIRFTGSGGDKGFEKVREYLRKVADSYVEQHYKKKHKAK